MLVAKLLEKEAASASLITIYYNGKEGSASKTLKKGVRQ